MAPDYPSQNEAPETEGSKLNPKVEASPEEVKAIIENLEAKLAKDATVPEATPGSQQTPATPTEPVSGDDELTARFKALQSGKTGAAPPPPRTIDEIEAEYDQVCSAAGKAYFEKEFHEQSLHTFSRRFRELASEATKRQKLDEDAKNEKLAKAQAKRDRKAGKVSTTTSEESGAPGNDSPTATPVEPTPPAQTLVAAEPVAEELDTEEFSE